MSIALLRYFVGEPEKEKSNMEIVSTTPPNQDAFLNLQIYLSNNRIKFVDAIPYAIGLFCSKGVGDVFVVVSNTYTPDWDMPDEKPPIMSSYFYSLQWLRIPNAEDVQCRKEENKNENEKHDVLPSEQLIY